MSPVLTYDPAITQCCINTNQKGLFPTLKALCCKKLPCSTHRFAVGLEPLLQIEEVFQPCHLSCVVGLTWPCGVHALRAAGRRHPSIASGEKWARGVQTSSAQGVLLI